MINLEKYWNGRDVKYAKDFTPQIARAGAETVLRINKLLLLCQEDGIVRTELSSGWRPKTVNDATSNAAKTSNHITGHAADIKDDNRELAQWCVLNADKLAICGLWIEDPRWCAVVDERLGITHYWVHLQTVPPKSGKLIYIPSTSKPKAPALKGQSPLPYSIKV